MFKRKLKLRPQRIVSSAGPDQGFPSERTTYWRKWLRIWNVIRPVWPVFSAVAFICLVAFGTDQGREAVKFAMTYSGDIFWLRPFATGLALILFAIGAHEVCWRAVSRDYPFSVRANPTMKVRFVIAMGAAIATPLAFFIFYLNTLAGAASPALEGMSFATEQALIPEAFIHCVMYGLGGAIIFSATYDMLGHLFRHMVVKYTRPFEVFMMSLFPVLALALVGMLLWNAVGAPMVALAVAKASCYLPVAQGSERICFEFIGERTGHQAARTGVMASSAALLFSWFWIKHLHRRAVYRYYANYHQFAVFKRSHNIIMLAVLGVFVLVVLGYFIWPAKLATMLGPVFTLLVIVGLMALIFTYFAVLASHNFGFPTILAVLFLMGLGPILGPVKFHDVWMIEPSEENASSDLTQTHASLPTLTDAVTKWSADRPSDTAAVVVLAEGGGIRAALHTAAYLSCLDERLGGELYDNMLTMSGVSGGAVGVGAYLAARADGLGTEDLQQFSNTGACDFSGGASLLPPEKQVMTAGQVADFLQQDFFSPALAGLIFRDFPQDLFIACVALDCGVADRARLFETAFIRHYRDVATIEAATPADETNEAETSPKPKWNRDWFRAPVLEVIAEATRKADMARRTKDITAGKRASPIILLNTFDGKAGRPAVVSNISFQGMAEHRPKSKYAEQDQYASSIRGMTNLLEHMCGGDTLSLATSAHLSARFPLVSPPGRLEIDQCGPAFLEREAERRVAAIEQNRDKASLLGKDPIGLFVDGGYFDNSGAASAQLVVEALRDADRRECAATSTPGTTDGRNCHRPIIVLHTIFRDIAVKEPPTSVSPFYEFATPVEAVVAARGIHGDMPIQRLCESGLSDQISDDNTTDQSCDQINAFLADQHLSVSKRDYRRMMLSNWLGTEDGAWFVKDMDTFAPGEPALTWIRSPLQFPASQKDIETRLPLGWLLGETGPAILDRVDVHVGQVWKRLDCFVFDKDPASPRPTCQSGPGHRGDYALGGE